LKAFDERLGAAVRGRIGDVAPDAFTCLGAALRHLTARLAAQPARLKLLLVRSDGEPYNEDEYSGAHGIDDVRQAVAQARSLDVPRSARMSIATARATCRGCSDPAASRWLATSVSFPSASPTSTSASPPPDPPRRPQLVRRRRDSVFCRTIAPGRREQGEHQA
jgi:hypothetical protein